MLLGHEVYKDNGHRRMPGHSWATNRGGLPSMIFLECLLRTPLSELLQCVCSRVWGKLPRACHALESGLQKVAPVTAAPKGSLAYRSLLLFLLAFRGVRAEQPTAAGLVDWLAVLLILEMWRATSVEPDFSALRVPTGSVVSASQHSLVSEGYESWCKGVLWEDGLFWAYFRTVGKDCFLCSLRQS